MTSPPPLAGKIRAERSAGARAKRTLDVALSALLLIAFLPLMALIGLAVAVSSAGPVTYRQVGDGMGQRSFDMRKFRTMYELPQLINVLRGDMSLAGLWQVSGRSGTTTDEAIRLDLQYIDHWSLRLDPLILLRTLPAVLRTSNAR
ncbi:hypothetical protein ABB07_24635 [Streptomyces incarnatus]|uniref:Bacterial sugar transferase domain-containing protein n=1 Tax=Streptomyces incarnatus TaxID=665007 RepID=A0ABM5TPV1_9ACTN|nr:hypothetical protein ABB07_24635 [Streptomyces incarnatus]